MFGYSPVFLEICSTHLTMQCPRCLFHINKHKDIFRTVTFVEKFQDEMVTEKTCTKKAQHFFGFKSEISRFQTYFTKSKSSYERHGLQESQLMA